MPHLAGCTQRKVCTSCHMVLQYISQLASVPVQKQHTQKGDAQNTQCLGPCKLKGHRQALMKDKTQHYQQYNHKVEVPSVNTSHHRQEIPTGRTFLAKGEGITSTWQNTLTRTITLTRTCRQYLFRNCPHPTCLTSMRGTSLQEVDITGSMTL